MICCFADTGAKKRNLPADSPDINMQPSSNSSSPGSPSLITRKYQFTLDEHLAFISHANGAVETNESSKLTEASLQDKQDQGWCISSVLQVDDAQSVQHDHLASVSQANDALETKESSDLRNVYLLDKQDQGWYIGK